MTTSGRNGVVKRLLAVGAAALGSAWIAGGAVAASGQVTVDLNKLESTDGACRAYIVVENGTTSAFEALKLDLVLFDTDGVVSRRLATEMAPLPAAKTKLKIFEVGGVGCETIGRVLLNDVLDCADAAGPRTDCLDIVETTSRASIPFVE